MQAGVVDIAGVTDTGRLRHVNQDDWWVDTELGICAVADGMGGHAHGEEASHLALAVLRTHLQQHRDEHQLPRADDGTAEETVVFPGIEARAWAEKSAGLIGAAVSQANTEIYARNLELGHPAGAGMGTTITGLYHADDCHRAVLFNVGDSRVYRYRNGSLQALTRDHTIYRQWEDAGRHGVAPPRNIILRALGLFDDVEVDLTAIDCRSDDLYLLCSDGLNDMLDDATLLHCLSSKLSSPSADIARYLVDAANDAGGEDNITVVIIKYPADTP